MDKNKKIGFAVIGYGGMGSWHASTCADDFKDTAELIGIYDIKPERRAAAEAEGIHAFSSREELLADDRIDLVTVATPNDVHKEIAIAAMAAGKNVISEKPVALSQEELEEMIAASKKYGKLFTVHQNRRWDPDFKCVQKILADNELGKVFRIESRVQARAVSPATGATRRRTAAAWCSIGASTCSTRRCASARAESSSPSMQSLQMSPTRNATTASESRLSSRATFRCMSRLPRATSSSFRVGISSARTAPPL